MFEDFSVQNTLILNINKVDKRIWDYISNPDNWCEAARRNFWEPDKAGEFDLLGHKTLEDFEKFIIEEEILDSHDEDTIEFFRLILLELFKTKQDLSKIDKLLISYCW